ncbi:MAG TPA: TetR/AcrR family transcriptional regulator [Mycobacterium sp.]
MARPDQSRAALLSSAALLFRRQGYAATGVKQILKSAEATSGSLYHHFPDGKEQLAAAVVDIVADGVGRRLRGFLDSDLAVADIVDAWIDLIIAGLSSDQRDGSPIEPIATEAVNASPLARTAAARAYDGWCLAVAERLRSDGWPHQVAEQTALATVALIEGALILSRIAGDTATLNAARAAAHTLLSPAVSGDAQRNRSARVGR